MRLTVQERDRMFRNIGQRLGCVRHSRKRRNSSIVSVSFVGPVNLASVVPHNKEYSPTDEEIAHLRKGYYSLVIIIEMASEYAGM
jgi:hypothetical protein